MYSELIDRLGKVLERVKSLEETLNPEEGARRIRELEERMGQPGFWESSERAQEVIAEVKRLKREVEPVLELSRSVRDAIELARIGDAENDQATLPELEEEARKAEEKVEELELKATLNGPHDAANAFLSIHAGAGGTEACDWASMLARMYTRFCEEQGFDVELVDKVDGEEAGVRSVTYLIKGPYAYGHLRPEMGVHRLVRISPFDAKSRRQTSFAAVDAIPELPDTEKDIEINPNDIQVDTFRAGGAGGQHVNKTDSAVRITHIPSGIVVKCQNERSQHSNRATAMKMLRSRLIREEEKKREAQFEKMYGEKGEIAFGSQIRSYTLQPFTLVKDHRTLFEVGNANAVLDGKVLPFIEAYLKHRRREAKNGRGAAGRDPKDGKAEKDAKGERKAKRDGEDDLTSPFAEAQRLTEMADELCRGSAGKDGREEELLRAQEMLMKAQILLGSVLDTDPRARELNLRLGQLIQDVDRAAGF